MTDNFWRHIPHAGDSGATEFARALQTLASISPETHEILAARKPVSASPFTVGLLIDTLTVSPLREALMENAVGRTASLRAQLARILPDSVAAQGYIFALVVHYRAAFAKLVPTLVDILAHWPSGAYPTFAQLDAMRAVNIYLTDEGVVVSTRVLVGLAVRWDTTQLEILLRTKPDLDLVLRVAEATDYDDPNLIIDFIHGLPAATLNKFLG